MTDKTKGSELLDSIVAISAKVMADTIGLDKSLAQAVADQVAVKVADEWGGTPVYIPKGRTFRALDMHRELYAKFNGQNYAELAHEYKISLIWCYAIVRSMRKAYIAERQADMFQVGTADG